MAIDTEKLRDHLKNDFGTAMMSGSPLAIAELSKVEHASDDELISMAKKHGVDPDDFKK